MSNYVYDCTKAPPNFSMGYDTHILENVHTKVYSKSQQVLVCSSSSIYRTAIYEHSV